MIHNARQPVRRRACGLTDAGKRLLRYGLSLGARGAEKVFFLPG